MIALRNFLSVLSNVMDRYVLIVWITFVIDCWNVEMRRIVACLYACVVDLIERLKRCGDAIILCQKLLGI